MTFHRSARACALIASFLLGVSSAPGDELGAKTTESGESKSGLEAETKGELSAYADTNAIRVWTPAVEGTLKNPLAGWSATGTYLVDVVSAASVDIVSTASGKWKETRQAATLSGTLKPKDLGVTALGAVSSEPDYLSLTAGGNVQYALSNNNVTPTLGYSYGHDTAGRTGTPFSVYSLELQRHSINAGLELVLDPTTLVTIVGDAILEVGHQEKPYRFLPIFAPGSESEVPAGASIDRVNALRLPGRISESDPTTRNRFALAGRLAQRLKGSTFVISERLYTDDWGLKASSTDLRMLLDASSRVFLWVHLRGHVQSGASFYRRVYTGVVTGDSLTVPRLRTGDRELSPLASGTFGAGMRWFVGSDVRPDAFSLILQAEVMTTSFFDALFIQDRQAFFSALQLEAKF